MNIDDRYIKAFRGRLTDRRLKLFDELMARTPYEFEYSAWSHLAHGVRWLSWEAVDPYVGGDLMFSAGPIWEGSCFTGEIFVSFMWVQKFAEEVLTLGPCVDSGGVHYWGNTDGEIVTPGLVAVMKAHRAWAYEKYPKGHPLHPTTHE